MTLTPHLIHDVNGRKTTVYRRPEGLQASGRTNGVTAPVAIKPSFEISDYLAGSQPSLCSAESQEDIDSAIAYVREGHKCVMFISDDAFLFDEELTIDAGDTELLIQLESRAHARLVVTSGSVVIKTFAEHHIPEIVLRGESEATIIVAADTGVNITSLDNSQVTVVPEVDTFGSINPQGANRPVIVETGNLHRILAFAN